MPGHQPRVTKKRAYLDTEFSSLNRYTCRLISIAIVLSDGPEFYVELTDTWAADECSDFVREIVLPQLDLSVYGRTTEQAQEELHAFLDMLGPVEVFSDAPDWDWPLLLRLIGPQGLPPSVELRLIPTTLEVVCVDGEPPHHALLDARILARLLGQVRSE